MKKFFILVSILATILLLTVCTSQVTPPPPATPTATASPPATSTATATPHPTPTATAPLPTPASTPTPPPAPLPPIVVAEGVARQDVMAQLPVAEVECTRQSLGEAAFGQFSRGDFSEEPSETEEEALSRCLSEQSLSRFFIGLAVDELGRLGDDTLVCMGDALSERDLHAVFFGEGDWGETLQAMDGCLNDEERVRAEPGGLFGDVAGEGPTGSPGLVDVGGRQLYLTCEGEGSTTVVMEAGGRGNSGSWYLVQPFVAHFTRVCAYDRAGTGYSESAPALETAQEIADELHSLLASAGVDGPYVLVGHSLGGILVRVFAHRYLN